MSAHIETHELSYGPRGWWVSTWKTYPSGVSEVLSTKTLPDFLLEQTSPEYGPAAATPQEAAEMLRDTPWQQMAVERIVTRDPAAFAGRPLEQDQPDPAGGALAMAHQFRDAGVHPYNAAAINRLAAATLSRDIENFLDGLGMVLQPDELDALTEYLEDRG